MKIDFRELVYIGVILLGSYQVTGTEDILKYDHKHRTHKAAEKANGLWCHKCYTMNIHEEYCMNVTKNDTSLHHKCEGDMKTCMVKRVSFSTSSSNSSANTHKVWSLERNCSQKCEPGCIIIGERIKLYQCTSCCEEKNFCNRGNGGERTKIRVCSTCCERSFCNIGQGNSWKLIADEKLLIFPYFLKILFQII